MDALDNSQTIRRATVPEWLRQGETRLRLQTIVRLRWLAVLGQSLTVIGAYWVLGIDLPIYPLKGYSVTMPVKNPSAAWSVSLSDDAHKLVLSRLGDRLRIAGTAELNGYDTAINEVRCQAIVKRVMELFPGAGDPSKAEFWTGLRPATPDNLPCLGATKYSNLFLNTGHGTLGWTHACGSGRILADIVGGRRPEIEFPTR